MSKETETREIENRTGEGAGAGDGAGNGAVAVAANEVATERTASGLGVGSGNGVGAGLRTYSASQVVCVECEHIREMKGETDEVIRRTRSEAAENAVLNAVRDGGVEPDWFVERWIQKSSDKGDRGDGVLVACAVFEDAEKCGTFRDAVKGWIAKLEKRGGDKTAPIGLRTDAALESAVAEHFTKEWARIRAEQMGKYAAVLDDARKSEKWKFRVVVGQYAADDANAKEAFGKVCEALNEAYPKDDSGEGGLSYSGYWDKVGDAEIARFCFGVGYGVSIDALTDALNGIGARFYFPLVEGEVDGVELEMAALVIAKMQGEENARKAREDLAKDLAKRTAEEVKDGVEKGIAEAAERAMK